MSYDDPYSLGHKAKYAKEVGMAGCFTWSLDQVSFWVEWDMGMGALTRVPCRTMGLPFMRLLEQVWGCRWFPGFCLSSAAIHTSNTFELNSGSC